MLYGGGGKYILLDLSDGETLVVHLRMTGKLLYLPASEPWGKHTHIVFALSDGHTLRYDDVRQFGTLQLTETAGCMGLSCLAALGPEPLDDDFTPQWLQQHMTEKKTKGQSLFYWTSIISLALAIFMPMKFYFKRAFIQKSLSVS